MTLLTRVVLLLAVLLVATATASNRPLPSVFVHDSPFQVGWTVGQQMRDEFHNFLREYTALNETLVPFYEAHRDVVDGWWNTSSSVYPAYADELRGLAQGSGVSMETIMLVTFREEIALMVRGEKSDDSVMLKACRDVLHRAEDGSRAWLAHNEDNNPAVQRGAFLLFGQYNVSGSVPFCAFSYPLQLPGLAFNYNPYVVLSVNAEFPQEVLTEPGVVGRSFINRDMLAAVSLDDAIARATRHPCACGFSVNVGDLSTLEMANIEVAGKSSNVHRVQLGETFFHANEYLHLDVKQFPDESSFAREARAKELLPVVSQDAEGFRTVLGDTKNKQWPIYRDAAKPDPDETLATAVFDLRHRNVSIWSGANPHLTAEPLVQLHF